jgi:hypothetical protein
LSKIFNLWVLESEALELILDAHDHFVFELDFLDGNVFVEKKRNHGRLLTRRHEQKALALALITRSSAHTVDVRVRIFRGIHLYYPID